VRSLVPLTATPTEPIPAGGSTQRRPQIGERRMARPAIRSFSSSGTPTTASSGSISGSSDADPMKLGADLRARVRTGARDSPSTRLSTLRRATLSGAFRPPFDGQRADEYERDGNAESAHGVARVVRVLGDERERHDAPG
jgi:hypothetical protein